MFAFVCVYTWNPYTQQQKGHESAKFKWTNYQLLLIHSSLSLFRIEESLKRIYLKIVYAGARSGLLDVFATLDGAQVNRKQTGEHYCKKELSLG